MEASRAVGLQMWTGREWAGGAPLTGSPLLFANGAGIGGVSSMVVPCFLVIFSSFVFSEAFANVVDGRLPSSGAALASVAVAAPIGRGLGCIFGTIANMLSDSSTGMVSVILVNFGLGSSGFVRHDRGH